ncbi:hypothetical protein Tco_0923058 [Tanacetum coccineum]|uniref:Uncharacterized protein n=1 Tax=Tanacetum coccineum TaxID=301880 RepID=A0ABQ5D6A7_9ASTR
MEPDISNMTLNDYLMYQGRHKGLERSCTSSKSVAPMRNIILVYHDSDEEDEEYCSLPPLLPCFQTPQPCATLNPYTPKLPLDEEESSFDEILDDLFRIGAENIRKMEHEVPNRCDDINDYEDCDQENGELLDLPTFSATNEIASDSEQVEENIDIANEKEEIPMKDIEMDENHDIDHSGTKEALQWSLAKDPFLVIMELNDQSSFLLHTIPSFISNEVKREFTTPHKFSLQGNGIRGRHFKSGLVRYHAEDDDGIFVIIDVARRSKLGAWLRACCLFIISSKSRGVFHSNSTLIFNFHFLNVQ